MHPNTGSNNHRGGLGGGKRGGGNYNQSQFNDQDSADYEGKCLGFTPHYKTVIALWFKSEIPYLFFTHLIMNNHL